MAGLATGLAGGMSVFGFGAYAAAAFEFSSSIDIDKTLYREDIAGSIALGTEMFAETLATGKGLSHEEAERQLRQV